jgi:small multidrug resistance pump
MQWLYLSASIIFDILATSLFKAHHLSRLQVYLGAFLFYGLSVVPFALAVRRMDLGLAYALWSALAILGVTFVGVLYFQESVTPLKVVSLGLIVAGIALLSFSGGFQQSLR